MVYEALREALVSGAFQPGEVLRQEALAAAIGVSRVPVRSALVRLAADGLVELNDRRGAVVRTHSAAQARQLYDIRVVLETYALRLSMRTMTPERIARLRELAERSDATRGEQVDAHAAFYAEFFDAASNAELVKLLEEIRLKLGRYLFAWRREHPHAFAHQAVIDAVALGDEEEAVRLLRANLEQVRDGIVEMIEREQSGR